MFSYQRHQNHSTQQNWVQTADTLICHDKNINDTKLDIIRKL
jgi:stalled ribosome alternative rescue factor ArfA